MLYHTCHTSSKNWYFCPSIRIYTQREGCQVGETPHRSPSPLLLNHMVVRSELFVIYMGGSRGLYEEFVRGGS